MKILTKQEIEAFTGLKHRTKIIKWLEINTTTLANYNLVFAGGINAAGLPIVQKLETKQKQKTEWKPNI